MLKCDENASQIQRRVVVYGDEEEGGRRKEEEGRRRRRRLCLSSHLIGLLRAPINQNDGPNSE
jgi:hypothetical protein